MKKNGIAEAMGERDYAAVRFRAAMKVAETMDESNSGRDVKALSLTLMRLLRELEMSGYDSTPRASLMDRTAAAFAMAGEDE